jgi:hypothetical protein
LGIIQSSRAFDQSASVDQVVTSPKHREKTRIADEGYHYYSALIRQIEHLLGFSSGCGNPLNTGILGRRIALGN